MATSSKRKFKMNNPRINRRSFMLFVIIFGIASLAFWIVVRLLELQHTTPNSPLIDVHIDIILFGALKTILSTSFGSCLVGIIIDQYRERVSDYQENFREYIRDVGLISVYPSSESPELIQALATAINDSSIQISCVGLGLSALLNRELLDALAVRLTSERKLNVNIILGDQSNDGVTTRVKEEKICHEHFFGFAYQADWPQRFPKEIKSQISIKLSTNDKKRLQVRSTKVLPMTGILQFDRRLFIFLYGSPNMRGGSQSVWLEFDNKEKKSAIVNWAKKVIEFHLNIESTIDFNEIKQ